MSDKWIRASEIGDYLYCKRSWFMKHQQGVQSNNVHEMAAGTRHHERHAHWVGRSRMAQKLGFVLIMMAAAFFALWYLG